MSDADGNVHMNLQTDQFSLFGQYSVVGRAFVIHAKQDDLGLGGDA
jgi:Cu/Zn superoxide dismutase